MKDGLHISCELVFILNWSEFYQKWIGTYINMHGPALTIPSTFHIIAQPDEGGGEWMA